MIESPTNPEIRLRPAEMVDKVKIYTWLACSDLTVEMLGPPYFPDVPVPSYEEFDYDYADQYFNDTNPMMGRCYIIIHNGGEIGQINYNEINAQTNSTEIDIWLGGRIYTGKGAGPRAISMLCDYLDRELGCKTFYIAPSGRNINAVKSYKKAGFSETKELPDWFVPDYSDAVLMVRKHY